MESKKAVIVNALQEVAKKLGRKRFGREDFYKNSSAKITRQDIEGVFGSFAKAMIAADLQPTKWPSISNEELLKAYDQAVKALKHFPIGHHGEKELASVTGIQGTTFRKRFGGLKNLLFEYKKWQLDQEPQKIDAPKGDIAKPTPMDTIIPKMDKVEQGIDTSVNKYLGKAAENLVVAELLFRGFNAQILPVDEGIDVFATSIKKNDLYLIQVKHSHYENPKRSGTISVTVSSFEKHRKSNVYYIFVLRRDSNRRDFLILPFFKFDELIKNGAIKQKDDTKTMSFAVTHQGEDDAFIGSADVSRYLNAWDTLL